jgi:hypothetical protein
VAFIDEASLMQQRGERKEREIVSVLNSFPRHEDASCTTSREMRNAYQILTGKPEGKIPPARLRRRGG